jgi:hypothetical protein
MSFGWLRNSFFRWTAAIVVGVMILAIIVSFFRDAEPEDGTIPLSTMLDMARVGEVERLEVSGDRIEVFTIDDGEFVAYAGMVDVAELLERNDVEIGGPGQGVILEFTGYDPAFEWMWALVAWLIGAVIIAFFIYHAVKRAVRAGMRDASIEARRRTEPAIDDA